MMTNKLNDKEVEKVVGGTRDVIFSKQKYYVKIYYYNGEKLPDGAYMTSYYSDGTFFINCEENPEICSIISTLWTLCGATGAQYIQVNSFTYKPGGSFKLYFVDDNSEVTEVHSQPNK